MVTLITLFTWLHYSTFEFFPHWLSPLVSFVCLWLTMCTCLSSVGQAFTFQLSAGGNNLLCNINSKFYWECKHFQITSHSHHHYQQCQLETQHHQQQSKCHSSPPSTMPMTFVKMVQSGVPDRSDWELANSSWETRGELKKWNRYVTLFPRQAIFSMTCI